jgi:hypothetical protein
MVDADIRANPAPATVGIDLRTRATPAETTR